MKKLVLAVVATAALAGSASAADLAARPYTKAPMMAPAYSWTGFYIFGGIGGGLWDSDTTIRDSVTGANILGVNQRSRAATAGLVPLALVTTGSSVVHGSPVFWQTASSAA
jgi:opacity protein-like surface antigen